MQSNVKDATANDNLIEGRAPTFAGVAHRWVEVDGKWMASCGAEGNLQHDMKPANDLMFAEASNDICANCIVEVAMVEPDEDLVFEAPPVTVAPSVEEQVAPAPAPHENAARAEAAVAEQAPKPPETVASQPVAGGMFMPQEETPDPDPVFNPSYISG